MADPRLPAVQRGFSNAYTVADFDDPAATVTGATDIQAGAPSVADPRLPGLVPQGGNANLHDGKYRVRSWEQPALTVTGATRVGSGAQAVADPRVPDVALGRAAAGADSYGGRPGLFGVNDWEKPAPAVTGATRVSGSNAPGSVADPRVPGEYHAGAYGVGAWDEPLGTVTGESRPPNGRFSVADPRLGCRPRAGAYRVLGWEEAASTITGSLSVDNGAAAVADPRVPPATEDLAGLDPAKPPPFIPVIVAADGTWHRPLTTLELAALQGFPILVDGKPLTLEGSGNTRWREAIGNAIPPPAAKAIGEQLLAALLASKLETFQLSANPVWVAPEEEDGREIHGGGEAHA